MTQHSLNEVAQERFEKLREKLKLDIIKRQDTFKRVIKDKDNLTEEEFAEFQAHPITKQIDKEIEENRDLVDAAFDFIGSLNLPPNLSLAIGLIISAHKTKDNKNLQKAIDALLEDL